MIRGSWIIGALITVGLLISSTRSTILGDSFEQTECQVDVEGEYVAVLLSDGVEEKATNFVSNGISFWSQRIGGNWGVPYQNVSRVFLSRYADAQIGELYVDFGNSGGNPELVGSITVECWESIERFIKGNPDSATVRIEEVLLERN